MARCGDSASDLARIGEGGFLVSSYPGRIDSQLGD